MGDGTRSREELVEDKPLDLSQGYPHSGEEDDLDPAETQSEADAIKQASIGSIQVDPWADRQMRLEALRLATACRSGKRTANQLVKDAQKLTEFINGN